MRGILLLSSIESTNLVQKMDRGAGCGCVLDTSLIDAYIYRSSIGRVRWGGRGGHALKTSLV